MRKTCLVAVMLGAAWAAAALPALAQATSQLPQVELPKSSLEPSIPQLPSGPQVQETPEAVPAAPEASPAPVSPETVPATAPDAAPHTAAPQAEVSADPVVISIRAMLADPALRKDANADDLAALEAIYAARSARLWITDMGFSTKAQAALFEIEKAGEWGLDVKAFELPLAAALPGTADAQALAELKLNLAILKYARYARGGRFSPAKISSLFDQTPPVRDPKRVLTEMEASSAPADYLRSLHPTHEQFVRLLAALTKARGEPSEGGAKPAGNDVAAKRLLINMERWRWMPESLGSTYVLNNSAAFMLYVIKGNETIFRDKTLVGTIGYATPVFSADMKTIVFNPDWNAPETVVKENIWPALQRKSFSILKTHKLYVSLNGKPVDATRIDWNRVNPLSYTFSQRAGPHNNLGKIKFLYPNRHTVYMHDTLPVRKKYFKQSVRMIGHECVRMEQPLRFAEILLAEANGVSAARIKELWEKALNSTVSIEKRLPVHMVYFTAVADDSGKVETVADVYGLDRKMAVAMFGSAAGFPEPPPESKKPPLGEADASTPAARRTAADNDMARAVQGFLGE